MAPSVWASTREGTRRRKDKIVRIPLPALIAGMSVVLVVGLLAQPPSEEKQVRRAVESFYKDFNAHEFDHAAQYATEDWNHINPFGGWTRGREAVLKELKEAHSTILKGVQITIEDMSVRFATPDAAVVTVINRIGTYYPPDGVDRGVNKRENERQIRTFVVVKRSGRWLVMQDQNTIIGH
jgi:uncharacterized protein (TIGR02246 family)